MSDRLILCSDLIFQVAEQLSSRFSTPECAHYLFVTGTISVSGRSAHALGRQRDMALQYDDWMNESMMTTPTWG